MGRALEQCWDSQRGVRYRRGRRAAGTTAQPRFHAFISAAHRWCGASDNGTEPRSGFQYQRLSQRAPAMTKRSYPVLSTWNGHPWLALAIRLPICWLFLSACWHKILHPESFALDVATYQFLPRYAVHLFAIFIPWLELVVGVCLLIGFRVRAAALLVWMMLLSFTIALGWALYLGLDMSCGCFASQSAAGGDAISW